MKNPSSSIDSDVEILVGLSSLLQIPEVDGRRSLDEAEISFISLHQKAICDVVVRNWRKSGKNVDPENVDPKNVDPEKEECKKFMTLLRNCASPVEGLRSGLDIMVLRSGVETIIERIVSPT